MDRLITALGQFGADGPAWTYTADHRPFPDTRPHARLGIPRQHRRQAGLLSGRMIHAAQHHPAVTRHGNPGNATTAAREDHWW